MITDELKKYIKEADEAGMDEEDIIINLLNARWNVEDVDSAIKEVLYSQEGENSEREQKKSMYFPLVSIFIAVLLIVGGVVYTSSLFLTDMDGYISANMNANVYGAYEQKMKYKRESEKGTMLFVGDIMLSSERGVGEQMEKEGDYKYPFLKIADVLKSADLTFGNLEGSISSRGEDGGGRYSFRADPKSVLGLVFAGFDVLSIANNHIFDWGEDAFKDTISILNANAIDHVGGGVNYSNANKPLIKDVKGTKVAFFAYSMVDYDIGVFEATEDTPGKSSFDKEALVKEIRKLKKSGAADIVVVSFHWGKEYKTRSYLKQQKVAYAMIDAGADLIIGHHPHVVQEVEKYKNGWIAYSLGNFIFDQSFSEETMRGLMLEVEIKNKKIDKVNPIGIQISNTFQPYIEK